VQRKKEGKPFISDNGNFIVDVHLGAITDPELLNTTINNIPGVVESGLFSGALVQRLIIGHENGHVEVVTR